MKKTKWLLTTLIMIGLVLGILVGQLLFDSDFEITMSDTEHAHAGIVAALYFVGDTVFLGLLKMLIIPLIASSVIVGVTSVGDFRELGRIGIATLIYYVVTMVMATVIGLLLVTWIRPGEKISPEQRSHASRTYEQSNTIRQRIDDRPEGVMGAMGHLVRQIIPRNIVQAAAEGKALPVIFFSILFGIVLTTLGEKGRILTDGIAALFEAIMKLVQAVIWLTPVGVFALLAWTVARIGLGVFVDAIGTYMFTVITGLLIHAVLVLALLCRLMARTSPWKYARHMRRALLTALGTDSSSATLPVTIDCATEAGVSAKSSGFVLPLGSTINMDGTALYEAVAVVFLAQAYGIELSLPALVLVAITATLAAIGAAGIPSAGLVTMVIVVETVNGTLASFPGAPAIPIAAIGLVVGVDRIVDMCRTTVNVWGDAVGAVLIDRLDRRWAPPGGK